MSRDTVLRVSDDEWRKQLQSSVRDALTFEARQRERGLVANEQRQSGYNVWRGCDQNVALRIQSGPSCGLVALQLALEHALNVRVDSDVDALLACALRRECSKLGEMFIAAELSAVANEVYAGRLGRHTVRLLALDELVDDDARVAALVDLLRRRALILIAYDADKDNTPAQLGGSRAHWAVIKGFLQPCATGDEVVVLLDGDNSDQDQTSTPQSVRAVDTFFMCLHSKSKRAALWRADALLQSSAQLTTPDNSRNVENQYVMPQNLRECLALKVIVIESVLQ